VTVPRALLVVFALVAVGLGIVAVRGETAKAANRVQKLHQAKVVLEQELWAREMELAKLRGPDEIRKRASELGLDILPPTAPQSAPVPAR
jgi:hypothetical protein